MKTSLTAEAVQNAKPLEELVPNLKAETSFECADLLRQLDELADRLHYDLTRCQTILEDKGLSALAKKTNKQILKFNNFLEELKPNLK